MELAFFNDTNIENAMGTGLLTSFSALHKVPAGGLRCLLFWHKSSQTHTLLKKTEASFNFKINTNLRKLSRY